jgi:hypothetical protein
MKLKYLFIGLVLVCIIVSSVSAGIFTIEDAKSAISVKTVSSTGMVSKEAVAEKDIKIDTLQTVKLELSSLGKVSESKTVQMYPNAAIFVSSDFAGTSNIMQTSTKEGYPLIEVYYGYQKSRFEPWQYYFRIEKVDENYAYVIYGDYKQRLVWLDTVPKKTFDDIIASGKIPEWKSINVGG